MTRSTYPPCQSDLACFRNDGHTGNHAYPLDTTKPQPVAPTPPDALLRDPVEWADDETDCGHPNIGPADPLPNEWQCYHCGQRFQPQNLAPTPPDALHRFRDHLDWADCPYCLPTPPDVEARRTCDHRWVTMDGPTYCDKCGRESGAPTPPDALRSRISLEAINGTRPVWVAEGVFERYTARTAEGWPVTVEWGEPDADGFYCPVFTEHPRAMTCTFAKPPTNLDEWLAQPKEADRA